MPASASPFISPKILNLPGSGEWWRRIIEKKRREEEEKGGMDEVTFIIK